MNRGIWNKLAIILLCLMFIGSGMPNISKSVKADTTINFQKTAELNTYTKWLLLDDCIYAYKGNVLKKLDLTGKVVLWQNQLDSGNFNGPIYVHDNGNVYVGTDGDGVNSYTSDGQFLKTFKVPGTGSFLSIYVSADGDVYAVKCDKKREPNNYSNFYYYYLYSIRNTGVYKWKSDLNTGTYGDDPTFIIKTQIDNFLIVQQGSTVYKINMQDGTGDVQTSDSFEMYDPLNNYIYSIANYNHSLQSLDARNLSENWSYDFKTINWLSPNSDYSIIFVSTDGGGFYAFDTINQKILWQFDEGTPSWGRAVIGEDGNIYVCQSNEDVKMYYLYKFSPTGEVLDVIELNAPADDLHVRDDGSFYYISGTAIYSSSAPGPSVTVTALDADTPAATIPANQSQSVKLTATFSDNTTKDVTTQASWSSYNPSYATVSNGTIRGVKEGTTVIYASYQGKQVSIPVTVTPTDPDVSSLTTDNSNLSLYLGDTQNIKVMANYSNGTNKDVSSLLKWNVDGDAVTIQNGNVKAVKEGSATLTGTYLGKTITIKATVTKKPIIYAPEVFSNVYNFSDLVSNAGLFDQILQEYTPDELKVIVPDKYLQKIAITHKPDILTNMDITVGSGVRSVEVTANGETRTAKRIEASKYNIAWASMKKGSEVTIVAKNITGTVLEKKILRLKEGTTTVVQDTGNVKSGNYSLKYVIENDAFFNQVLDKFSLSELKIGVPTRYLNDITVDRSAYTTTVKIKTTGAFAKIVVVTPDGVDNQAQPQGDGFYTRDIPGLNEGDTLTIRVYDDAGRIIQEKPAFVD